MGFQNARHAHEAGKEAGLQAINESVTSDSSGVLLGVFSKV